MTKPEPNNLSSLPLVAAEEIPASSGIIGAAMGSVNGQTYISVVDERNRRGRPPKSKPDSV